MSSKPAAHDESFEKLLKTIHELEAKLADAKETLMLYRAEDESNSIACGWAAECLDRLERKQ